MVETGGKGGPKRGLREEEKRSADPRKSKCITIQTARAPARWVRARAGARWVRARMSPFLLATSAHDDGGCVIPGPAARPRSVWAGAEGPLPQHRRCRRNQYCLVF